MINCDADYNSHHNGRTIFAGGFVTMYNCVLQINEFFTYQVDLRGTCLCIGPLVCDSGLCWSLDEEVHRLLLDQSSLASHNLHILTHLNGFNKLYLTKRHYTKVSILQLVYWTGLLVLAIET